MHTQLAVQYPLQVPSPLCPTVWWAELVPGQPVPNISRQPVCSLAGQLGASGRWGALGHPVVACDPGKWLLCGECDVAADGGCAAVCWAHLVL